MASPDKGRPTYLYSDVIIAALGSPHKLAFVKSRRDNKKQSGVTLL